MVMQKGSKQLHNFKLYTFLRIFKLTSDNLVISSQHSGSFPGNETWPICFITLWLCPTIQTMQHNNNKFHYYTGVDTVKLRCFVISNGEFTWHWKRYQWFYIKWKNIKNGKIVKTTKADIIDECPPERAKHIALSSLLIWIQKTTAKRGIISTFLFMIQKTLILMLLVLFVTTVKH